MRGPSGERVDLTGTWVTEREGTRAGLYYLQQVGECIWLVGAFPAPGDSSGGPLGYYTVVLRGRIGSDFLITGDWVDVRHQMPEAYGSGGRLTLQVEFGETQDELRLVYAGGTGQPFVEPGYREEQSWLKISGSGAYPPAPPAP